MPSVSASVNGRTAATLSALMMALVSCGVVVAEPPENGAADAASPEQLAFYTQKIEPLLRQRCLKCHSGDDPKGGLSLTSRERILAGGESGPAVELASPGESLLIEAINYNGLEMPPAGKLPPGEIELLTRWVEMGLPLREAAPSEPRPRAAGSPEINDQTRSHWAFRPLMRPDVPRVEQTDLVANPIDAFVLARLEAAGLPASPPAEPRELMRRVHYGLLGLPPEPQDVEQFAVDPSPDAYRALIDRLLESPRYGEHWARHWLDVVRYAESNSYERDNPKPFVWRYRDYVIDAFNTDKPFDRFILEQLAGDELDPLTPETIIATGYYRLGLWDDEPVDAELAFYDGLDDVVGTTSQAFLGLTMNCARCHEHKLDPIPQEDYYRFLAFFRNVRHYGVRADPTVFDASVREIATAEERAGYEQRKAEYDRRLGELRSRLDALEEELRAQLQGGEKDDFQDLSVRPTIIKKHVGRLLTQEQFDEYARLHAEWKQLRDHPPAGLAQALCVKENGPECPPTFVLARGSPAAKTVEVEPGFPAVLSPPQPQILPPPSGQSSGRRLALAQWIASPSNPLTARVITNRIWQWHFGRGLVRSSNNFGLQGDRPTHPELLDWLACEFIDRGWSVKELNRLILTSNTYRLASHGAAGAPPHPGLEADPQNDLFWRFDPRRLRAEEIRDSILAVNGSLNTRVMHGPSVYEVIPAEVLAGQSRPGENWGRSSPEDRRRRSIYIHVKRSLQVPLLAAFDAADTDFTCPVRFATTQPTQALTMLNSQYLAEQAGVFAAFVRERCGDDLRAQVACALHRATQRPPAAAEIDRGLRLIAALQSERKLPQDEALKYFCLLALNLNEFLYVD